MTKIVKTEGVIGGKPRIESTRIGVNHIIASLRAGCTIGELYTEEYPHLSRRDVTAAVEYYFQNEEEMDWYDERRAQTAGWLLEMSGRKISVEDLGESDEDYDDIEQEVRKARQHTIYMVEVSHFDDAGGAFYRTRDAAEQARDWFEEYSHGSTAIREVPLNDGFAPPNDFHANYLKWGYGTE